MITPEPLVPEKLSIFTVTECAILATAMKAISCFLSENVTVPLGRLEGELGLTANVVEF
jgi:hypothetical protein